ncbi:MAG: polyprenyl synthetase family protein, partial [Gammaproteobacteria bacterium]
MSFERSLNLYRDRIEDVLERWLPPADQDPGRLHQAMRYAVVGGGKRVRPLLVYLTGEALAIDPTRLDGPAAAVELIHAYSLVHDDLPAMDDDDLRRGRPTCHRAFDEATAILAGDALQVLAFQILAEDPAMTPDPNRRLAIVGTLARASGTGGMAGGQAIDLSVEGTSPAAEVLEQMHARKTGALIRASVLMAALSGDGLARDKLQTLAAFGEHVGLAFQIQDDILDEEGETGVMGKNAGADSARAKPNYPGTVGIETAKIRARDLCDRGLEAIGWL